MAQWHGIPRSIDFLEASDTVTSLTQSLEAAEKSPHLTLQQRPSDPKRAYSTVVQHETTSRLLASGFPEG
jgi:hypothetical protein